MKTRINENCHKFNGSKHMPDCPQCKKTPPTLPRIKITRAHLLIDGPDGVKGYGWTTVVRAVKCHKDLLEAVKSYVAILHDDEDSTCHEGNLCGICELIADAEGL